MTAGRGVPGAAGGLSPEEPAGLPAGATGVAHEAPGAAAVQHGVRGERCHVEGLAAHVQVVPDGARRALAQLGDVQDVVQRHLAALGRAVAAVEQQVGVLAEAAVHLAEAQPRRRLLHVAVRDAGIAHALHHAARGHVDVLAEVAGALLVAREAVAAPRVVQEPRVAVAH